MHKLHCSIALRFQIVIFSSTYMYKDYVPFANPSKQMNAT